MSNFVENSDFVFHKRYWDDLDVRTEDILYAFMEIGFDFCFPFGDKYSKVIHDVFDFNDML